MYFLNGLTSGFICGASLFLVHSYPTIKSSAQQELHQQTGWFIGVIVGFIISITVLVCLLKYMC